MISAQIQSLCTKNTYQKLSLYGGEKRKKKTHINGQKWKHEYELQLDWWAEAYNREAVI